MSERGEWRQARLFVGAALRRDLGSSVDRGVKPLLQQI